MEVVDPVECEQLQNARIAFNAGNYSRAIEILEPFASDGNEHSQLQLSVFLQHAPDGFRDIDRAVDLARRAKD